MARRLGWSLGVAVLIAAGAVTVLAYWPRVFRAEGTLLSQPVVVADSREISGFWDSLRALNGPPAPPQDFAGRPYVELSFFFPSAELNAYLDAGKPAAGLRADEAEHHARFYPAVGDAPAWLVFSANDRSPQAESARRVGMVRWVLQEGLDILAKHGIPIRVPAKMVRGTDRSDDNDGGRMSLPPNLDREKLCEAALAILGLTAHEDHGVVRAWKGLDLDLLETSWTLGYRDPGDVGVARGRQREIAP